MKYKYYKYLKLIYIIPTIFLMFILIPLSKISEWLWSDMEKIISSFIRTTAVNKIAKMTARKKVVQGGSSARFSPDRN